MVEFRKTEREEFVALVADFGLTPEEMVLLKQEKSNAYRFEYVGSGLTFTIYPTDEGHRIFKYSFTSYNPKRTENNYTGRSYVISDVIKAFKQWISQHVVPYMDEMKRPDPWEQYLLRFQKQTNAQSTHFTQQEIIEIEQGLDNFPKFLEEQKKIDPDKLEAIKQEIDELKKELREKPRSKFGKRFMIFLLEEVWDAVKDEMVMNHVKKYFLDLFQKGVEQIPNVIKYLLGN